MKTHSDLLFDINNTSLKSNEIAFWWLGQIGYAMKLGETVIYIDAYLYDSPKRTVPTLLHGREVSNADIVIGTHDHSDHIDRSSWPDIAAASENARFLVPNPLCELISNDLCISKDRLLGIKDMETLELGDVKITGIPAAHEFLDKDDISGDYMYTGCVISYNGFNIYHSGDTCIYEGLTDRLRSFGNIDLMIIPINGRDASRYRRNCIGNMTYQEAVDLAGTIKPGLVVPAHYDMIYGNTEDVGKFIDYLDAKYPDVRTLICTHGEKNIISK